MERNEYIKNITAMIVIIIFSAAMILYFIPNEIRISTMFSGTSNITSRTFPYMIFGLGLFCAVIELIKTTLAFLKNKENLQKFTKDEQIDNINAFVRQIIVVCLFISYAVLFMFTGYLIPTLVIIPLVMFLIGERDYKKYLATLAFLAFIFIIFTEVLSLNIPLVSFL